MDTPAEPSKSLRKILRKFILGAVCLLVVIGLFYTEEDERGKWAWNKFKRAEEADGEKLDMADVVPPAVPDEQNFAMTPLLRVTFDYVHTTNGAVWRDTNAWHRLNDIRVFLGESGRNKLPDLSNWGEVAVDLEAFANFYQGNTNYPQSASSASAAERVLTALNRFEPDLKELREAAAARPLSRFPVEYDYEPTFDILLPHLASLKGPSQVCELRAIAELETHRSAEALADLQLGFRLSDSIRGEPMLISHLVRVALLQLTLQGVREGLARHAWTDAQLVEFEKYLASLDLLHDYLQTMRGERAVELAGLDYYRRHGFKSNSPSQISKKSQSSAAAFNWMPLGWYHHNMVLIGECYRDYILLSVDESDRTVFPGIGYRMARNLEKRRTTPYNFFAKMLMPALVNTSQRSARAQTLVDEARVACAIERYRMEYNELPDTLDELTPQFISKIPNDVCDVMESLHYKKNGDGTYVLYSIGWNQEDDGGTVVLRNGSTPGVDVSKGDWVWQ